MGGDKGATDRETHSKTLSFGRVEGLEKFRNIIR